MVCNISCWEEDDGSAEWMNELRNKLIIISQELMAFVEVMEIYSYLAPPQYALASRNGTLHCAVRGRASDANVYLS